MAPGGGEDAGVEREEAGAEGPGGEVDDEGEEGAEELGEDVEPAEAEPVLEGGLVGGDHVAELVEVLAETLVEALTWV